MPLSGMHCDLPQDSTKDQADASDTEVNEANCTADTTAKHPKASEASGPSVQTARPSSASGGFGLSSVEQPYRSLHPLENAPKPNHQSIRHDAPFPLTGEVDPGQAKKIHAQMFKPCRVPEPEAVGAVASPGPTLPHAGVPAPE